MDPLTQVYSCASLANMSETDPWAEQPPTWVSPWAMLPDRPIDDEPPVDGTDPEYLLDLLDKQADLIVAVGTGGPAIDTVNADYRKRRRRLRVGLKARGLEDPFPFDDLWAWYGHYSQHIPSYAGRRAYVRDLAKAVRTTLENLGDGTQVEDPGAPPRHHLECP